MPTFNLALRLGLFFLLGALFAKGETNLPALNFCDGPGVKVKPVEDGLQYVCATTCQRTDNCPVRTETGLIQLTFIVDKMAGHLYYNPIPGAPTLFMHTGGGGTVRYPESQFLPLRNNGLQVVEIQWEKGVQVSSKAQVTEPLDLGWFTRSDGAPSDMKRLSIRPGAVAKWIHDNLSAGQRFGTSGCSGGSLATFLPVYFHGLDSIVDYQWLGGGPYYDIGWACGAGPKPYALNQTVEKFALPTDKLVDYIHKTGTTCQKGQDSPAFAASSPRRAAGNWTFHHPVDFNASYGQIPSDEFLGVYNQEKAVSQTVKSDAKTEAEEVGPHCAAHTVSSCQKVCAAMLGRSDCGCESLTAESARRPSKATK